VTWLRAIGGPAHDRWFDVNLNYPEMVFPLPVTACYWTDEPLDPLALPPVDRMVYTVEKLIWPGWRFPIRVLVAPGVKIQGHRQPYDSSWPNPPVPPRCRCEEIDVFPPWVFARYNTSACHLDHCPVHGRWTFPPLTPLYVSLDARAKWLFKQQTDHMRQIKAEAALDAAAMLDRCTGRPE
jgi:hypothetical protein